MFRLSPIVVGISLIALVGCLIQSSFRKNYLAIGLTIICISIFFTSAMLYFTSNYIGLLLK